ncbi:hypothetical protein [Rhodohalobacter sp. SW132]|nr:hypothetical protein [Rhodohalobacter sp. SW132]
MDKQDKDKKKNNKSEKRPVNKNPQFNPEKDSDSKAKSKKG